MASSKAIYSCYSGLYLEPLEYMDPVDILGDPTDFVASYVSVRHSSIISPAKLNQHDPLFNSYSAVRARLIFTSTYVDAFNPDLYLHITKPDTIPHSIPYTFSWSIFSIPDTLSRAGFKGVLAEMWGNVTCAVADLQQHTQDVWERRQQYDYWPPT